MINTPKRHYRTTEKYLRALEKNINIVMTITENGERSTGKLIYRTLFKVLGMEDFVMEAESPPLQVERNFIVSVSYYKIK